MEYFDVVDENRNLLGYTKARGSELDENEYNVGVEVWIFSNNKLFLTRRSFNKSHPGQWEVPGGCSQAGESSLDTLLREAFEEVGIKLGKNDYSLLKTVIYKKQFVDIYKGNININLDNIKLQEEEVIDAKLVTKDEFLDMVSNGEIVKSVFNRYEEINGLIDKEW